jgi:hypothetical protein
VKTFTHRFVEFMPDRLEDGILYVSLQYSIVSHRCPCGCGEEVVVKLSPTDWKLTFDGESVSLHPSLGNWGLKCRSHYWIQNNQVGWASQWSEAKIRSGRIQDAQFKRRHAQQSDPNTQPAESGEVAKKSFWSRVRRPFQKH